MSAPDWVKNEEDEALWGEGLAYDGAPISNKVALLAFLKAKKSQLEHKGIPTSLYSLIVGLSVYLPWYIAATAFFLLYLLPSLLLPCLLLLLYYCPTPTPCNAATTSRITVASGYYCNIS